MIKEIEATNQEWHPSVLDLLISNSLRRQSNESLFTSKSLHQGSILIYGPLQELIKYRLLVFSKSQVNLRSFISLEEKFNLEKFWATLNYWREILVHPQLMLNNLLKAAISSTSSILYKNSIFSGFRILS